MKKLCLFKLPECLKNKSYKNYLLSKDTGIEVRFENPSQK